METAKIFENLKALQEILVQKYELEVKVQDAPKQLTTQNELLARLKKEYIAKNTEYDEIKEKVNALKLDLEEAVKSREAGEKGMDNITTHREYEALEKQITEATNKENDVRKDLQHHEKILAELKENLKNYEDMISSQEADLTASKENLDKEISEYNKKLEALKAQEAEITPNLDQEILFKFERIIQRNSEGIVSVRKGVCSGCHMILPAQFANTVRNGENINFCPYCSRILYYEEVEGEQTESYFDFNSAGSLADLDDDDDFEEIDEEYDEENEDSGDMYGDDQDLDDESDEDDDSVDESDED
ncbi:MAG: zinc ribbon domain-containing protein [Treponema sp.]|nr:zinc ribbon domain-containing protein [Spirochaetia bacterium]MDY2841042.1 zinc ribbon domain-containing protein [Treponema sp.]MDY5123948.1 zinc ribbon domain-containing protein [Treponema sp.]